MAIRNTTPQKNLPQQATPENSGLLQEDSGTDKHWFGEWATHCFSHWDQFWFAPQLPHTLALIRICCGAMLVYVHVIWCSLLLDFMGPDAWIDQATIRALHQSDWAWSWLWYIDSPALLWTHQTVAILASGCMMLGLGTRLATPLAWWMTLMVCHRMTLALFGLDQIVILLSMYLMLSHCGSVWSLDALLARRRDARRPHERSRFTSWLFPVPAASTSNRIATRLIQLHLCIIYLFGGLGKMRGEMWYDGSALWFTIVNYEYQSLNLTWLGHSPLVIATLSASTIFWETFYCALVWPKGTRPLVLLMAVFVHGGIGLGLGMITFGFIMIVANAAFIQPTTLRSLSGRIRRLR